MAMAGTNDNASRIARSAALTLVISVAVLYLGDRFGMLMDLYDRPFLDCYMEVMAALPAYVAASPLSFSFEAVPLLYGCGLFLAVWLVWLRFSVFIGNYRAGEEAGSARWGTRKEGEAFRNADEPDSNILLTEHYAIATRRKDFDLEHDRNLNVMVIGGSGSGKTRYYVKPKQSPVDRLEWSSLLNLSEQEEECIDESVEPGDGLLIAGAARIPIRGKFPDKMPDGSKNPLYALFSTNPNDV